MLSGSWTGRRLTAKPTTRSAKYKYVPQAQLDAELARLEEFSRAALAGDTHALDGLRAEMDHVPDVWRRLADLQILVEEEVIRLAAGEDPLRREAFRKRCSELRVGLLGGQPASMALKFAASRLVAVWLFAQFLELRAVESPELLRNVKQLEQAERRLQVAMRTFLMVRQADAQLRQLAH